MQKKNCPEHFIYDARDNWSNGFNGRTSPKPLTERELEWLSQGGPDFHVHQVGSYLLWHSGRSWHDDEWGVRYQAPAGVICRRCGAQIWGHPLAGPDEITK